MTTFDSPDARVSIFKHLTNLGYWTTNLPDEENEELMKEAHVQAEDFASMIVASLDINPIGISEDGALIVEMKPLDIDALEDWLVEYSEGFEVAETLDE